ncbi:MAG: hypothetical protein KJN75_04735, partial [Muriicola sp.]|nr:hypothetical protein [Muriicola sp.]
YAADYATGNIRVVDFIDGSPDLMEEPLITGLSGPEGLALDKEGRLLVVETGESRLLRIDTVTGDMEILAEGLEFDQGSLGEAGPPSFFFDAVAVGPSGDIYVTGGGVNVIYKVKDKK